MPSCLSSSRIWPAPAPTPQPSPATWPMRACSSTWAESSARSAPSRSPASGAARCSRSTSPAPRRRSGARSAARRRRWTRSAGWRSSRSVRSSSCRSSSRRARRGPYRSARQPEQALRDDVGLHLRRTAGDRGDARPEPRLLPAALRELAARPLEGEAELVEALRQLGPEELHERRLGPRLLAALEPRQRAAVHEPHDLDVDPAPRDLLADDGIAGAPGPARERDRVLEGDALQHPLLEGEPRAARVRERRHGDLPALVHGADHLLARHLHPVEEDLAELRRARRLPERTDGDARAPHVEEEVRDAAVFRQRGIGAGEQDGPAG